ncbi:hypothetical protein HanPSC8_Chr07g0285821 [Helianthus annuus]|nr:hypothetical protein HanPSC8_Chr07g0285821 [Helianthus annuus]
MVKIAIKLMQNRGTSNNLYSLKMLEKIKFPLVLTQFDRIHSCGSKNYLFLTRPQYPGTFGKRPQAVPYAFPSPSRSRDRYSM